MKPETFLGTLAAVGLSAVAFAQSPHPRQWIVYCSNNHAPSGGWKTVPGGDYDGRDYLWFDQFDPVGAGFYDLTVQNTLPVAPNTDPFPVKPAMYAVEQWSPAVLPSPPPAGWDMLSAQTTYTPSITDDVQGEAGTRNPFIPWLGAWGTNHQQVMVILPFPGSSPGQWMPGSTTPNTPSDDTCNSTSNEASAVMWLMRGSTVYFFWGAEALPKVHPLTALRLTEVIWDPGTCGDPGVCASPVSTGPLDLRCVGNADPLYGPGEPYADNWRQHKQAVTIDGSYALAVNDYSANTCGISPSPVPPYTAYYGALSTTGGLPTDGTYTADGVVFRLHYDGVSTIKWKDGDSEFDWARVVTLGAREFVTGRYKDISLLTCCSGGSGNQLIVKAVYSDGSSETHPFNLFDWFNQSGDANSIAVGASGNRRDAGDDGFWRFNYDKGWPQGYLENILNYSGGDSSGAFLFLHIARINETKALSQIELSVAMTAGMNINLLAVSLNGAPCNIPWADADGDRDVDETDFGAFQRCLTLGNSAILDGCGCMDSDLDSDVDGDDLSDFLQCAMGPGIQYTHSPTPPYWPNWPAGCPGQPSN